MKRTRATSIVILATIGALVTGLVQVALASSGRPTLMSPVTLPLALAAIGVIVVSLALPIRRMTRRPPGEDASRGPGARGPVDPFYATRVVMLAKASALGGALLTGAGIGLVVYLLTRSVLPGVGSIASAGGALFGAAVLLTCGLIAESMCTIPPSDDDDHDGEKPVRVRP